MALPKVKLSKSKKGRRRSHLALALVQIQPCPNCKHLDTRMVKTCAICAHETRELRDVSDALVDLALRNGAEIRFIDGDPDMEKAGQVAALLRFRADQNTAEKKMAV